MHPLSRFVADAWLISTQTLPVTYICPTCVPQCLLTHIPTDPVIVTEACDTRGDGGGEAPLFPEQILSLTLTVIFSFDFDLSWIKPVIQRILYDSFMLLKSIYV